MSVWLGILSLAGLGLLAALVRRVPAFTVPEGASSRFRPGDAAAAGALFLFYVYSIFAAGADRGELTFKILADSAVLVAGMAGCLVMFLVTRGLNPVKLFGLAPRSPWRVILPGALCLLAAYPAVQLLSSLASWGGESASDGDDMVRFFRSLANPGEKALAALFVVVVAPLYEELVFRGYLYGVIRQSCGRIVAAVTVSLLFAAAHTNLPAIPALFVLSLALMLAYELAGSLWAPVAMHMVFNGATVVLLTFFPDLAQ